MSYAFRAEYVNHFPEPDYDSGWRNVVLGNSLIGESSAGGTTAEHIEFPGNGAGAYRVYVCGYAGNFDTANPYTLLVQLGGAPPAHKIYLPVVLKRR